MEMYYALAVLSILIFLCACASKLSSWINMPCLLVFLGIGMLAGSEGIGGIAFDNATFANVVGSIAMAFILITLGFVTRWVIGYIVLGFGGLLSSLGVLLTALFVGIFAYFFLRWQFPDKAISLSWCLLLGSIISSTDAAAVFSILRSRSVSLKGNLKPLLEFESGSNDPMAAFLTIFMLGVVTAEAASGIPTPLWRYAVIAPMFLLKMSLGIGFGYLFGRLAVWLFNKIDFEYDGLYYVIALATVLFSFAGTELLYGNGFMAVYITGMVMGNKNFIYHNGVGRFYDGLAWLMQVVLFTMLGLLAFPTKLWSAKWIGLAVAVFLMLIARPLAVFLCTIGSKYSIREKTLVSWVGLRGGAPIMLATFPLMAGIANDDLMFHIVFFIVLTSVFIQGMSLMPAARLLHLDSPLKSTPRLPLQFEYTGNLSEVSREIVIPPGSPAENIELAQIGLPKGTLVLLIRRNDRFLVPQGDTVLAGGDTLMLMGSIELLDQVEQLLYEAAPENPA